MSTVVINNVGMSVSKFTIDFYRRVCNNDANMIISPYNIASAMMLTALGCVGATSNQILTSLYMENVNEPHRTYGSLQDNIELRLHNSTTLSIANKIFPKSGLHLKDSFLQLSRRYYKSTIQALDYSSDPDGERHKINQWVETQTHGKIVDLIPEGAVNNMTINILVTAIYFKGLWKQEFSPVSTYPTDFYVTPSVIKRVPMMESINGSQFHFGKIDNYKCYAIELPYKDKVISMFVLLPFEGFNLSNLESQLSFSMLNEIQSQLVLRNVNLKLPKFKIDSTFNLKTILENMGIMDIFLPEKAEMFAMFEMTGEERNRPYINSGVHRAFIEVNEEGTEATAATAVSSTATGLTLSDTLVVNRPFLYFIQDNETKTILFIGKFCHP